MTQGEAIAKLHEIDGAHQLWSLIRGSLSYCRKEIEGIAKSDNYEVMSAHKDEMARIIVSYVAGDIRKQIKDAEARVLLDQTKEALTQ